jgi:predicted nucleotide-binding protein
MTTMSDKIRLIQNLKKQVKQLKMENRSDLDAIQRNIVLLINRFFGELNEYKTGLKEIDFPEADPYENDFPEKADTWYSGKEKMVNLLDTMIKDLKISEQLKTNVNKTKSNSVFIVHGTDHQPVKELKVILRENGLRPIILHEQAGGSRTIVEKLEKYSDVGYAFVILTPDDVGGNFQGYKGKLMQFSRLDIRARQNVVLEFGYFIGHLGREKVCCLYKGNIELPSDMHGICYVHFQDSINEVKGTILKELEAAGYQLKK